MDEEDEKYVMRDILMQNVKQLEMARTFLIVVGGCCAGVLNATNLKGLFVFLAMYILIVGGVALKIGFDFKNYTNLTLLGFTMQGMSKHALSFILFWTLSYAMIYIY
jgi:ER membrane protein complex subunit 6